MKLGTLSFEIIDKDGRLTIVPDGADRVKAILRIIEQRKPGALICAGFTLDDREQLHSLGEQLVAASSGAAIILEVKNDSEGSTAKNPAGKHRAYVWNGKDWRGLPHQTLVEGADADDPLKVAEFEKGLPDRAFQIGKFKFGVLVCGEIGIVRGEQGILSQQTATWVDDLDVVVNPTHTRMSYSGRLEDKRSTLGKNGRLYISVSNWESRERGQRPSETLHTIYLNGSRADNMVSVEFDDQFPVHADGFVYREYDWFEGRGPDSEPSN